MPSALNRRSGSAISRGIPPNHIPSHPGDSENQASVPVLSQTTAGPASPAHALPWTGRRSITWGRRQPTALPFIFSISPALPDGMASSARTTAPIRRSPPALRQPPDQQGRHGYCDRPHHLFRDGGAASYITHHITQDRVAYAQPDPPPCWPCQPTPCRNIRACMKVTACPVSSTRSPASSHSSQPPRGEAWQASNSVRPS